MAAFFGSLSAVEKFFFFSALAGGLLFAFRLVLLLLGAGEHGDGDADSGDADDSFRLLSLQSLTAFFMMFGLVGLALSRQSAVSEAWAFAGGTVAGLATVWLIGRIFVGMKKLQSDGTVRPENAVGQEGRVYLTIKPGQTGQIEVPVQGRLRIFDAVSDESRELQTGTAVRVRRVVNGHVMVVEPA